MSAQIAELAGGLALFAAELLLLWGVAEVACQIFFKIREREGKGE